MHKEMSAQGYEKSKKKERSRVRSTRPSFDLLIRYLVRSFVSCVGLQLPDGFQDTLHRHLEEHLSLFG